MSGKSRDFVKWVALGFVIPFAIGMITRTAVAAVGDVLETVAIPAGAQCGTNSGTAVAVVPGGKARFPNIPILLVTSCVALLGGEVSQAELFFINPSTAALANKPLPTTFTPALGWGALALRADKGDLLP